MGAPGKYSMALFFDKPTINQEPARGLPASFPPTNVEATFANEERGRKAKKGRKNRFLMCCSNVNMAVLDDEEGKEDRGGRDKGVVAPGNFLGNKSCLVLCFSNLEVGTIRKSPEIKKRSAASSFPIAYPNASLV